MRVGVLGTGIVGQTLGGKIAEVGHAVMVGTRDVEASLARTEPGMAGSPPFSEWLAQNPEVKAGTFAEAAAHGEVLFNATNGSGSLEALRLAGSANLDGKILVDVSNPLDFSAGMPPTLFVSNSDSLGEQIQNAFPGAKVVKTLNTVTAFVMVDPGRVGDGDHHAFVSGNDPSAKAEVARVLREWFGWKDVIDLGDISTARGTEMYLALWIRLFAALGTPMLNVKVVI
jgi:predicted dinucleotide-binding enzyme